jgi:hypothetical protein
VRRATTGIRDSTRSGYEAVGELIRWPTHAEEDWARGFLAGIVDAEGHCSRSIVRISNTDAEIVGHVQASLTALGFRWTEDVISANGRRSVRLLGGQVARARLFHSVDPAITRMRFISGEAIKNHADLSVVAVEPLGVELPMFDITTGTGDFIANGVVSHNCFARSTHWRASILTLETTSTARLWSS